MWHSRLVSTGSVLLLVAGVGGATAQDAAKPKVGDTVYVAARLESLRKSLAPATSVRDSYNGAGVAVQHPVEPYVVEPCSGLQVVKVIPGKGLVRTRDDRGMKHTFAGDWSSRMHRTEKECRAYLESHPKLQIMENTRDQYEMR